MNKRDLAGADLKPNRSRAHRGRWLRTLLWSALHLLAGAALCGLYFWTPGARPLQQETAAPGSEPPAPAATSSAHETLPTGVERAAAAAAANLPSVGETSETAASLARADMLLLSGQVTAALSMYESVQEVEGPAIHDAIQYRMAVCYEVVGDLDRALAIYRSMTAASPSRTILRACQLGQARLWQQRKRYDLSKSLLATLMTTPPLNPADTDPVQAYAAHLLAQVCSEEALQHPQRTLLDDAGIVLPNRAADVRTLLELIQPGEATDSPTSPVAGTQVLARLGSRPDEIHCRIHQSSTSLVQVLQNLCDAVELQVQWSEAARQAAQGHSVSIHVDEMNAAAVLDLLLEPLGLMWSGDDRFVLIESENEIPDKRLQQLRLGRAERACRAAVALHPEHERAASSNLSLGNLAYHQQQLPQAESYYREIIRREGERSILPSAWFNLAKTLNRMQRFEDARQAFFRVVDHARGQPLEPVAYLFLGRLFLEEEQLPLATKHLVRAATLADGDLIEKQAALTLAAAYLAAGNPYTANETLMKHRALLQDEPFHNGLVFLSALCRFRAQDSTSPLQHRGRDLTSALVQVEPSQFFGYIGYLLVGQAYDEIGLSDQMEQVYQQAIEAGVPSVLRDRMMFLLANHYLENHRFDRGTALLVQLSDSGSPEWQRRSRLRLARWALAQDDHARCLTICQTLLHGSLSDSQKHEALRLMGRTYEQLEEPYKAAICFAGLVPKGILEEAARVQSAHVPESTVHRQPKE